MNLDDHSSEDVQRLLSLIQREAGVSRYVATQVVRAMHRDGFAVVRNSHEPSRSAK